MKLDGTVESTDTVGGAGFVQRTDGTWTNTSSLDASEACSGLSAGTHTLQIVDASGKVLAEGTYTLTP